MIHIIDEGYDDKFALTSRSTLGKGTKDFINQGFSPLVKVQTHRAQKSRSYNRIGEHIRQSAESRETPGQLFARKIDRNIGEKRLPSISIGIGMGKGEESHRLISGRRLNESAVTVNELKKMLESSPKKSGVELQNQNFVKNFLIEEDYDHVGAKQARDEERENVKTLDRWRLEVQRKAMMSSMDRKSEMRELYRQRKESENNHIPNLNNDALNKILIDSEEDFSEAPHLGIPGFRRKGTGFDFTEEKIVKGIEGAMIDSNHGLLTSLIERKVETDLKPEDVQKMTVQHLRLQIKMLAETVIMKFRALKKNVSDTFVQNQVERILKKIKSKPSLADALNNGPRGLEDVFDKKLDRGVIIDYRMKETSLIREYEQSMADIQTLGNRLTNLNHENFQFKRDIAIAQDQIQQVNKVYKTLEMKYEEQAPSSASSSSDGKRKGKFVNDENPNMTVDIQKLQKARHEKRKQEHVLNEKIKGFQENLAPVIRETETVEAELKVARGTKAYYKMQLKDLYYQILKDDKYLMQSQSDSSCTWIIKSLWTIGEEVKPQDFPAFMDRHSIKFMLDYAKVQNELEKFCKHHNLSMLANLDEFKSLNLTASAQSPGRETSEKQVSIAQSDSTPKFELKPKSKNELLEDFKNRMQSMKKENIRAKRMINMVQYNAKGRVTVSKWEDINPFITNEQLMNHIQGLPVEIASPSPSARLGSDKLKLTKLDFSTIDSNPAETAQKMLLNLDTMKNNELNRIIKESVSVQLDERIMTTLSKTFRFMLGRAEGIDAYRRFLKEKKAFEDKNMKSDQTHKKSQSQPRFQGSQVLFSMLGPQSDKLEDDKDENKSQSPDRKSVLSRSGTSISPLKITSSPMPSERATKFQFGGSTSSRTLRMTNSMCK